MHTHNDERTSVARSWIFGLNLLIACAAQIAATFELLHSLVDATPK